MDLDRPRYINAVMNLVGSIDVSGIADGPLDVLRFHEEVTLPSEEDIQTELTKLQAEYDANQYQRDRASHSGYPSIPDQLDEIYHNGIDSWKAVIKVTKDKYPKG